MIPAAFLILSVASWALAQGPGVPVSPEDSTGVPVAPAPGQPQIAGTAIPWDATDLDAGLALAGQRNRPLLAIFVSDQCSDCRRLEVDLADRYRARLPQGLILARIPADTERGTVQARARVVLDLPASIVFSPEGQETDRVVGYAGEDDWLIPMLSAAQGRDPLAGWQDRPGANDPELAYQMGWRLLVRGDAKRGQEQLKRVYSEDPRNIVGYTPAALRLLARYNEEIRDRSESALAYWRALFEQDYDPRSHSEALAALIRIYQKTGDLQGGFDYLSGRTRGGSNDPARIDALASFSTRTGFATRETIGLIREAIDRAPSDALAATLVRLLINEGRAREARDQVEKWRKSGWEGPVIDSLLTVVVEATRIDDEVWQAQFDAPPQILSRVAPECPESAMSVGASGQVVLNTTVDVSGRVVKCVPSRSSGVAALDEAAIEAVMQWTFRPAKKGGQPVEADILVPLSFDCR
jgi:protein TonB